MNARMLLLAIGVLVLTGCAVWRPAEGLLAKADRLAVEGQYTGALGGYDELLREYPNDPTAVEARQHRQVVADVLATRTELVRLRREAAHAQDQLARVREELRAREAETARLRSDLSARQGEAARLAAEAERLRADLEQLKKIDLQLERPRQ